MTPPHARLHQVPAFDNDMARKTVEDELAAPIPTIFSEFSPRPIAAASLGQVLCCPPAPRRPFSRARVHIHTSMHTHICIHMHICAYTYMHAHAIARQLWPTGSVGAGHRVSRR